jgi:cytochrome c biogenesis protein CcmG/thiol:disulfide interchange protein DsbE
LSQAASPAAQDAAPARGVNRRVLLGGLVVALPLLVILVANLGRDPHTVASPMVGRQAPGFALTPVDGGAPVSLAALAGRPVVLNFWATWCVPCFEEHGVLTEGARELGSEVQFLGVVYEDEPSRVQAFLTERGGGYPSLVDPDSRTAIAYGVFGVPETFFIDARGSIVAKHVGPLTVAALAENVRKAREGPR